MRWDLFPCLVGSIVFALIGAAVFGTQGAIAGAVIGFVLGLMDDDDLEPRL